MAKTKIEWADRVWNPVTGCSKVSPGCANCYAERMSKRFAKPWDLPEDNPFKVTLHSGRLGEPMHWKKPSKIFVCSMSDLFHKDIPESFIDEVFGVILAENIFTNHQRHDFLILTKRADRLHDYLTNRSPAELLKAWAYSADWLHTDDGDVFFHELVESTCCHAWDENGCNSNGSEYKLWGYPEQLFPLKNVWLGVTAENQEQADRRVPILLQTPATRRFVSVEPMLSAVDLRSFDVDGGTYYPLDGDLGVEGRGHCPGPKVDWVICGGESGPGARPMNPDWVRSLREQCQDAGTPFLFKQWGEWAPLEGAGACSPTPICYWNDESEEWVSGLATHRQNMVRIGKKKAGRTLDGQLWNLYPVG